MPTAFEILCFCGSLCMCELFSCTASFEILTLCVPIVIETFVAPYHYTNVVRCI